MATATYRQIAGPDGYLANRKPFTGHSMRAEWTTMCPARGHLGDYNYDALYNDWCVAVAYERPMYVVWSYRTPIAWCVEGKPAFIVDQQFSATTSKQQGYVRAWINRGFPVQIIPGGGFAFYRAERERLGI